MQDITDFGSPSPLGLGLGAARNSEATTLPSLSVTSCSGFARLRGLLASFGPETNKHERVLVLISACIVEGMDTFARIIGALVRLGFNRKHVALLLKEGTGNSAEQHRWRKGADGRYSLID